MKRLSAIACLFFILTCTASAQYQIEMLDSNTFTLGEGVVLSKTSFRGLSVPDNKNIWVSGSRGTIARSTNGGKTFLIQQIKGYETSDFRDIEAFGANQAIVMSSGTPAYILKTNDGGRTWKEVYKDDRKEIFLDAMDFWDANRGVVVGDPVNGHFLLLSTTNGGESFTVLDTSMTPAAYTDEALFAASGTAVRCWGANAFGFVTGGSVARFIRNDLNNGRIINTRSYGVPVQVGKQSKGAFSFVTLRQNVLVVGGDYANDTLVASNVATMIRNEDLPTCLVFDGFVARSREEDVNGYRSAVELIKNGTVFIACGTSGVDIGTTHWKKKSEQSFNVVSRAKKGRAVYLAGGRGKIGRLVY